MNDLLPSQGIEFQRIREENGAICRKLVKLQRDQDIRWDRVSAHAAEGR
jgi:hypothetical protein